MIQVDDVRQGSSAARPNQARPLPESTGRIAAPALGAPDEGPPVGEEEMVFVSPPPAPFPRIFPGL
jgi:hypothetical protein